MAKLSRVEVVKVARLAKLELTEAETSKYLKQLSKVVDYVGKLAEISTSKVEATNQTTGRQNVYRVDEIKPGQVLKEEEALSGSENTENGYFKVPAILQEK